MKKRSRKGCIRTAFCQRVIKMFKLSRAAWCDHRYSKFFSYDFKQININVILRDVNGVPIAINKTNMNTVLSQEQRDFTLVWTSSFPGEMKTMEADIEANIFNDENFIEQYSSRTEKFQQNQK